MRRRKGPTKGTGEATAESRRYETPNLSRENTSQLGSGQSREAFQRLGSGSVEAWTRELDDEDELWSELKPIELHQEPTELISRIQAPAVKRAQADWAPPGTDGADRPDPSTSREASSSQLSSTRNRRSWSAKSKPLAGALFMEQDLLTQIWWLKPVHQIWWLKTGPGVPQRKLFGLILKW